MVSDISVFDIASYEIFKDIIQNGPITAYSIKTEKNMAYATVHQHFKDMEKKKFIKIYEEQDHRSGQKKKFYGPTLNGIVGFCRVRPRFKSRLEFIYLKWKGHEKFVEELQTLGFDIKQIENDPKAKKYFIKYLEFMLRVTKVAETLNEISLEEKMEMVMMYYSIKNPEEYFKFLEEFSYMPGIRKQAMDEMREQKMILERIMKRYEKINNIE